MGQTVFGSISFTLSTIWRVLKLAISPQLEAARRAMMSIMIRVVIRADSNSSIHEKYMCSSESFLANA